MKSLAIFVTALFAAISLSCNAQTSAAEAVAPAPDYAQTANWVCRPGSETVCTTGLDAMVMSSDGKRSMQTFKPAADPPVDCFYVYPTVSREQTVNADLADSPEVQAVVKGQAGRLTSKCRVFAPIYRQVTLEGLRQRLKAKRQAISDKDLAMADVEAAWKYYLDHDNGGRGVVLVGHSQGTILLQQLLAKQIDGTPVQERIVSVFLAGDPTLGVPSGKLVGGTFAHIPVCAAAEQTGCIYVWGSFLAEDTSPQVFGSVRKDGLMSACENPAAPGGGTGAMKFYFERPNPPADEPRWVESVGQLSGSCVTNEYGNGFRVTVQPGPGAAIYRAILERSQSLPGWGLHVRDVNLVQGNMLDVLDAEIASWRKTH